MLLGNYLSLVMSIPAMVATIWSPATAQVAESSLTERAKEREMEGVQAGSYWQVLLAGLVAI